MSIVFGGSVIAISNAKKYVFLHATLLLYSTASIFSKLASQNNFLSIRYCLFYGVSLALLFVYAMLWQQILKRLPLTKAFLNKSIVIVWGMLWGSVFFQETITWKMLLSVAIVFAGVYVVVTADG